MQRQYSVHAIHRRRRHRRSHNQHVSAGLAIHGYAVRRGNIPEHILSHHVGHVGHDELADFADFAEYVDVFEYVDVRPVALDIPLSSTRTVPSTGSSTVTALSGVQV
jgi:hypothetical protein